MPAERVDGNGFAEFGGDSAFSELQTGGILAYNHFVGGDGQSIKAELAGFISAIRSKGCLIAHGEGDGVGRACP